MNSHLFKLTVWQILILGTLPLPADSAFGVKPDIATGSSYTVTLKNDGTVRARGTNGYNQLSNSNYTEHWTPVNSVKLGEDTTFTTYNWR